MIIGTKKAAGYIQIFEPSKIIEKETRQCVHCGVHWIYQMGSGKIRGFCLKCMGITCGSKDCDTQCIPFEKRLEQQEGKN